MKRPAVGISQKSAITQQDDVHRRFRRGRATTFGATLSSHDDGLRLSTAAAISATGLRSEAPDVDDQERDEEQEQEGRDRRAEPEEVLAAERATATSRTRAASRRRGSSPARSRGSRSKTFSTPMICVTKTTVSTGASSGTVTRRKTCHSVAPSVRAASSTSRGIAERPAAMITMREAGGAPRCRRT